MQTITITSEKNRHYTASIDGKPFGTLHYPKWYSQDAEIMTGNSAYSIKGKGFWKTNNEVLKDGKPAYEVNNKWRGTFISRVKEAHHFYALKHRGLFKSGYNLEDHKGREVLIIRSEFTWKKFRSDYGITFNDDTLNEEDQLLMLITLHCYHAKEKQNAAATAAS